MMQIIVLNEHKGSRIERFLVKQLNVSKVLVYKLIRERKITVFRKSQRINIKQGFILESHDIIKIFYNICFDQNNDNRNNNLNNEISKKFLYNHTIWDDTDFAIIFKQKGLASQSGKGIITSLDNLIKPYLLVHRLDRQTEGLMIIAKTVAKARFFGNLLKSNIIEKYYICGLNGHLKQKTWVDKPLLKTKYHTIIDENIGKQAQTHFIPVEYFPETNQTIAIAKIIFGRTHQIRVHAQYLNLSIINDDIYDYNESRKYNNDKPLYLCSYAIKFSQMLFRCYDFQFPNLNINNDLVYNIIKNYSFSD